MKASEKWDARKVSHDVEQMFLDICVLERRAERAEERAEKAERERDAIRDNTAIYVRDEKYRELERERDEAREAYSREYTANLDADLRVEQMRLSFESLRSFYANMGHQDTIRLIDTVLSLPIGSAAREVLEALAMAAQEYELRFGECDDGFHFRALLAKYGEGK